MPPFSALFDFNTIFPNGIYTAVLPVREKTIGVIAIVAKMCGKCSHFRLMLAVEEMKIAQPETCAKYFVTKKTSSDRRVIIHLGLHESCGNLCSHLLSSVSKKNFLYVFAYSIKKKKGFDNSSFCGG